MPVASPTALLVIDVQNDFIPGGHLPVPEGDRIVPLINRLGARFTQVLISQDWHRPDMRPSPPATRATHLTT